MVRPIHWMHMYSIFLGIGRTLNTEQWNVVVVVDFYFTSPIAQA